MDGGECADNVALMKPPSSVRIAAGTDAGTALNPSGGLIDEPGTYVERGMDAVDAIQSATVRVDPLVTFELGHHRGRLPRRSRSRAQRSKEPHRLARPVPVDVIARDRRRVAVLVNGILEKTPGVVADKTVQIYSLGELH